MNVYRICCAANWTLLSVANAIAVYIETLTRRFHYASFEIGR
jgi:hypothetical protein